LKKKFSLRAQFISLLLIFVLLILGLTYILQTSFLDEFYKTQKIKDLESTSHVIANNINDEDLSEILDKYTLSNEVCVRIVSDKVDATGYNQNTACALRRLDDGLIHQIKNEIIDNGGNKLFSNFRFAIAPDNIFDIFIYGEIVRDSDALVLVSSMITPLSATISTIKSQYLLIVIAVVFMTVLLGFMISKLWLKPIKEITNEISKLPQGNYDPLNVSTLNKEFEHLNNSLKNANEQIVVADKAKKDLLANVTHDLRTPLTMIVGYGEMMKDIKKERNDDNIDVIISEAKRLNVLVDDLIDVSKAEAGKIELTKEETSVNDLINSIYKQYKKYCKNQNVDLKIKLIEDKIVSIDIKRITQVIYNFINNALNYNSKDKKEIIIGTEIVNNKYRIYVYDNGDGIKEKDIPLVWDRYYKVDKEHKRSQAGSGIGLALSKNILELHNLEYGVESIENEYTKFYFFL